MRYYKYVSPETGKIVLQSRTLRWTTPALLNDPYDIQFDLHIDIDRVVVRKLVLDRLWDAYYGQPAKAPANKLGFLIQASRGAFPVLSREQFNQEFSKTIDLILEKSEVNMPRHHASIRDHMARSKILCLSEIPDSLLMWAHYAKQHRGLVLQFENAAGIDSPWKMAKPVRYVEKMPRFFDENFLADLMSGGAMIDSEAALETMIYTKANVWNYEHEQRISTGFGRTQNEYEDILFHPLELTGVILGCRMDIPDREEAIKLMRDKYPHASISHALPMRKDFCLEFSPHL